MPTDKSQRLARFVTEFVRRNHTALDMLNSSQVYAAARFGIHQECGQFAGWEMAVNGIPRFRLGLGHALQPVFRDEAGKQLQAPLFISPDLSPDEKRILWRANEAWAWYTSLIHNFRAQFPAILEAAMLDDIRWQCAQFTEQFMAARLVRGVSQQLIWGIYHDEKPVATFRVSEDETLVDFQHQTLLLPNDPELLIGIIHPALLTPQERHGWGVHLHDYQIIQPFAQIARDVYSLANMPDEVTEQGGVLVWEFQSPTLLPKVQELESHTEGWVLASSSGVTSLQRRSPDGAIQTIVSYSPRFASVGGKLITCRFELVKDQRLYPAEVPPVVLSEALYLIRRLLHHDT